MDRPGRRSRVKRQTRLSFVPHGSSSPGLAGSPPDTQDRLANVRYVHPFKDHGSSAGRGGMSSAAHREGSRGISTLLPTPENSSQVHQAGEEEDSDDVKPQAPSLSSPCPAPTKPLPSQINVSSDEEEDIRGQVPSRRRPKTDISEDEESSSDPITPSRKAKPERPRKNRGDRSKGNATSGAASSKLGQTPTTKAFSVENATPPKLSLRQGQSPLKSQISSPSKLRIATTSSPEIVNNDEDEDEDEEEELVHPSTARSRRLGRKRKPMIELSEDSEEDIVASSPAKRRKRNVEYTEPQTPNVRSEQDQLDLEEDLEDIQDSVTTKTRTRGRLADSAKDKRQKQLDILRRRRAGEKPKEDSSPSENESENSVSSGNDDAGEGTLGYHYISSDNDEHSDIEPGVPPNEDLDRYEDDFVLQDDDEQLGAPTGLEDMPLEFTRQRYKQPREFFKDVVEWMVHNKLNPEFNREDNVYRLAFMRLNDEANGRVGSQYVSAAWNVDFKRALEARPEMNTVPLPRGGDFHSCDACNKTNHPASFVIQFRGDPYYLETLDPVSGDEDSDDEGSGTRDRKGNSLPESSAHFYLGRHCKSKATMAHTLIHWRQNLNGWILDYLIREDISTKKEMRKRKRWSQERKAEYVHEAVGMMEEKGEIDSLWRDFHLNLKAAREDKEFRW